MNCTSHERHLGRRLTLTAIEGRIAQIDHQERLGSGPLKSLRGKPTPRDDVRVRLEDGRELSASVRGRRIKVAPGQRVTSVCASRSRTDLSLLYFYNHDTRAGWFNDSGFSQVRRGAPYRMLLWMLPMLILLGAWMSPQQTRADLAGWIAQTTQTDHATSAESETESGPRLFGQARTNQHSAPAATGWASQPITAESIRHNFLRFILAGWQDGRWLAFGFVAALVLPLSFMLGHAFIVWPASRSLRRRAKRLAQQHVRAIRSA